MSERTAAPLDLIPDALAKTGFVLEHQVAEAFKAAGWSIIGGRYYADDVDGRARELDLIAYKSFKLKDLTAVYSVLISCKKDAENTWTFLTRGRPSYDPNFDWDPVHYWTDVNPLENYLESEPWKSDFISSASDTWDQIAAARDVFAFQQIHSTSTAPKNDTAIFNSITTLMKGLDYELLALPQRQKNKRRIYFFSLLSVVDAPLVEANYSGENVKTEEIDAITYFARYMVRKREMTALMRFVRSDVVSDEIARLDNLAVTASDYASRAADASFAAIRTNQAVRKYFASQLQSKLNWWLEFQLKKYRLTHDSVKLTSIDFKDELLRLELDGVDDDSLAFLNSDPETLEKTASALKQVTRFEGDFLFVWDIPF